MKLFAFILAVMVLILSDMPCKDDAVTANGKIEVIRSSSQQNHRDHTDACSPFCQCACCAGFSINHTIAAVSNIAKYNDRSYNSFLPSKTIEIAYPVWQPPKL